MNYPISRSSKAWAVNQRQAGFVIGAIAALAAAALYVRRKARQAEHDNPPIGQFLDVDGVRLHYIERGQGQPVVLLHGNGTFIQDFEISGVLGLASSEYRVIVFDRPGYGYSDRPRSMTWDPTAQAELLRVALHQLGVEQPIVVGHSWGTLVALAMALSYPAYVRSLVLLGGYYFPSLRLDVPVMATPAIPVIGDLMRHTISPLLSRLLWPGLLRVIFGPADVPQRFGRFPVWMALRPSQLRASAAESALMIPAARALSKRYHQLKMPVYIVAGEDDRFVGAHRHSARLHDELPNSRLRMIPGAGHMLHYFSPGEVMTAIRASAAAA